MQILRLCKRFLSRNVVSVSETSAVNLIVRWWLFACSMYCVTSLFRDLFCTKKWGYLNIRLSNDCCWIKCQFCFKLGTDGRYCVTKGKICVSCLRFRCRAILRELLLKGEFQDNLFQWDLWNSSFKFCYKRSWFGEVWMLRPWWSLCDPWWVAPREMRVLKSFSSLNEF